MKIFKVLFLAMVVMLFAVSSVMAATWQVPGDYATIAEAITASIPGDRIMVGPGNHYGAYIDKRVEIKGEGGAVINDGPVYRPGMTMGFRLIGESSGSTISNLTFTVEFPVMNGAGVDDVTVTLCTFESSIQAISNWRGSGWEISHNKINNLRAYNGGGIGILVGDYMGGLVHGNVISHNKISGTLKTFSGELGGYSGSGIVLFADFRWGYAGTTLMSENRIIKNNVSIVSESTLVDIAAFELTDSSGSCVDCIKDNAIGFNDFRGTASQIVLTPNSLDLNNSISKNLGENRGQGLHPSVFGPGGN